jgi:hypothetical protein
MGLVKILVIGTFVTAVTGCQTVGRVGSPLWHMTATDQEKLATYTNTCVGYGFVKGTPEIAQCIAQESRDSRASASDRMKSLSNYNRTVNCTSIRTGTIVNTNCR